ncbi:hypothetical protein DPMN_035830 [Dreissena polymorpha]|uniref:Uncharacterized protein n=1 Tax=Dreissena polymorpha TaxID=45954 RepID=A0A9D4RKX4_DREPO|nr:hypothetical protein DPMN_035830 [Dreissena polymorpha]
MSFMEEVPSSGVTYEAIKYFFSSNSKQFVDVRVHWLPIFVDNRVLSEMFEEFGTVISIKKERMEMEDFHVISGVRVVWLQMDEEAKNLIPHLLGYACVTKALLTVRGRQPLCLKCLRLEHVRGGCPSNNSGQGTKDTSSGAKEAEGSQGGYWANVVSRRAKKQPSSDVGATAQSVVGGKTTSDEASKLDHAGRSTVDVNSQTGDSEEGSKGKKKAKKTSELINTVVEPTIAAEPTVAGDPQIVTDPQYMDTDIQGVKSSLDEDEVTPPLPKNRTGKGPVSSPQELIDRLAEMFTQDTIRDGILGVMSPYTS